MRHLALAITYDPANVLARGLAGLVSYQGKWQPADDVERSANNDPAQAALISEYLERRARTPHKADTQLKLAAWCAEKGLKEQALAHYTEVTLIDPSREAAWKHLGYVKRGNHWVKPEDAAAQKLENERQRHADQHWKTRLEKLREGLESSSLPHRNKAREGLAEVTDPRAVPMVMHIFGSGSEPFQLVAIQLLSQIQGPAASLSLTTLALDNPSAAVRRRAADALARRDPRDIIGRLIARVHKPYRYEVKSAQGPGSTAALIVDGEKFDVQRFYRMPDLDLRLVPAVTGTIYASNMSIVGGNSATFSPIQIDLAQRINSYQAQQRQLAIAAAAEETRERDLAMQQTLENDVRLLDDLNAQITETNDRVLPLLQALTGQDFGADQQGWQKWWSDQLGLVAESSSSTSKPTYTDNVSMPDTALTLPVSGISLVQHSACFAAGTMVHAIDGLRPIESLQVGDLVLSQNTTSGALSFQPVVAVHRNKPQPTLKLAVDQDAIVATGIHRFWKAGSGWTMARDLKAGDKLRMIGGAASIQATDPGATQPIYNLDVAQNRDFFVGKTGLWSMTSASCTPCLRPSTGCPSPRQERRRHRMQRASEVVPRAG